MFTGNITTRPMYKVFILVSLYLVSCTRPCPPCQEAGAVRAQVIDSLKAIYTFEQGGYTPKVGQATPTRPKQTKTNRPAVAPTDSVYIDKEGVSHPILQGKNGGRYYMRISKKTGKEYKSYLKTN